ncbi:14383_t:CDS:10 [Acaulospora morrowiae]|uniref:14383_t:CDS:1 n=1 Tax=Acaulospora morrowiae TaxID=94023 RepID=A0A9N9G4M3_9GLOM|nr:14383_t:CDS:10 [Acaulospora morrowiae]
MSTGSPSSTMNQYIGPNAEIAKLLLTPSPNLEYLQTLLNHFLSLQNNVGQKYTLNLGFSLFYMFQQITYLKLSSDETGTRERIEWIRAFLRVFSMQGFVGFVGLSGLLNGYQMAESRQGKRLLMGKLIVEVEGAFFQSLDSIAIPTGWNENIAQEEEGFLDAKKETVAYICGYCIPSIPLKRLEGCNAKGTIVNICALVILKSPRIFHDGEFVNHITRDVHNDPDRRWKVDSPSYKTLQEKKNNLLFRGLPRISRGISSLALVSDKNTILNLFTLQHVYRIYSFSAKLFAAWEECPLSLIENEESLDEETKLATPLLWTILKPIVFFVTVIFKYIVDQSLYQPEICGQEERKLIILSYSYLYFINSKFSLYGFPTYKKVFFSVLDRSLDEESESKILVNSCQPPDGITPTKRSQITYYLLVVEQLMAALDDDTLENYVLPFIYPYINDKSDSQLFESAHSVILSVFSNFKRVSKELAPYYCTMLLEGYSMLFTIVQFRAAYAAVIKSLSEIDDALVWLCLDKLIKKIEVTQNDSISTELGISERVHEDELISPSEPSDGKPVNSTSDKNSSKSGVESILSDDSSNDDSKNEYQSVVDVDVALYLRRGHLLLTLIDQIQNVNLLFLETLLTKIKEFLQAEPDGVGKFALKKALFDALSMNLDYTKKEVGVRWWLAECDQL